jgi:hypothetical protein
MKVKSWPSSPPASSVIVNVLAPVSTVEPLANVHVTWSPGSRTSVAMPVNGSAVPTSHVTRVRPKPTTGAWVIVYVPGARPSDVIDEARVGSASSSNENWPQAAGPLAGTQPV